jgi:DNA-binding transcriptional ArsR family regulator
MHKAVASSATGPSSSTIQSAAAVLKALANDRRLEILNWLKDPRAHFPPQVDGDLVDDGVCSVFIAQKLKVSPPTASEHLRILTQAGLLRAKRIKQWTFYQRDERRIADVKRRFRTDW